MFEYGGGMLAASKQTWVAVAGTSMAGTCRLRLFLFDVPSSIFIYASFSPESRPFLLSYSLPTAVLAFLVLFCCSPRQTSALVLTQTPLLFRILVVFLFSSCTTETLPPSYCCRATSNSSNLQSITCCAGHPRSSTSSLPD